MLLLTSLAALALGCHGGRILAIFQSQNKDNYLAYEPLVRELFTRGHNVTVVSSFPRRGKAVANYTDLYVPVMGLPQDGERYQEFRRCRHFLRSKPVNKLIRSPETFDLMLLEFDHHQCFLGFIIKYHNVSLIGLSPTPGNPSAHDLLGNTSPYAYVPDPEATLTDHMSFAQRVTNAAYMIARSVRAHFDDREYSVILADYFASFVPLPSIAQLEKKMSFVFFNNDVSLSYPRPLMPNMADVAGLHIRPPRRLPKDLQTLLDGASADVVLVDMGPQCNHSLHLQLDEAFSKLHQLILWKTSNKTRGGSSNVRVKTSFPLADVLAHPKVRVLVTHGELLSVQEAVYHAVPMVVIPLQPSYIPHVHRARDLGFVYHLAENDVTSESVQQAIRTVLHQPSYKQSARVVSERFRDQPIPPLQKAVYWTEYVLRFKGAHHLQSSSRYMPWYEYLLLDVVALLALGAILAAIVAFKMLFLVDKFFFGFDDDKLTTRVENKKQK